MFVKQTVARQCSGESGKVVVHNGSLSVSMAGLPGSHNAAL